MEDTVIKTGHYAYQFRVDLELDTGLTRVIEFIKKYDVKYYIVGAETSNLGKQHFQCILWFSSKINTAKLRNWWKGKTLPTKQPVSMTSAKKIKSLGKYTTKGKNFTTNLTKEEISKIGQWSPKVKAADWSKLLDEHASKFDKANIDEYEEMEYADTACYFEAKAVLYPFIGYMLDFYKANNKRPSRASLQYLAWKHGHMSNRLLIKAWF